MIIWFNKQLCTSVRYKTEVQSQ